MRLLFISLLFAMIVMSCAAFKCDTCNGIQVEYQWKYINFTWNETSQEKEVYGGYNTTNCVLYDVDRAEDGRIFVTSVRDAGVPASLMTISDSCGPGGPLLRPYPNWSWYQLNQSCSERITSVYRVDIKCNHLFVLDCGQIGDDPVCPPQLLIFDLSTDKLVKNVPIPADVTKNNSLLVTPIVDVSYCRRCKNVVNNAVVFMADTVGIGLVVWQAYNNKFCRFESKYMEPTDPYFTIEGQSFNLSDGILGMTLVNEDLYYAPLSGNEIFKMKERTLTGRCFSDNITDELTQSVAKLSGQTGPMASKDCAIFFSNVPQTSVLCADTGKPINSNNMVVISNNSEILQFISGMKTRDCKLYMLSNRLQRGYTDTRELNETNYRIITVCLEEIRRNTSCFDSCYYNHCNNCFSYY